MRRLALKVVALLAPFVALSMPPLVKTVVVMSQAERSVALRDGVFDSQLEGKWRALMTDGVAVVVAGDSRAERQIVPAVIEERTGWRAANVASTAQDLVTFSNAVQRHGLPSSARVVIVSASSFQINDGAIDAGYLSTACLLNMTTRERLGVYADRLGSPWSPLWFGFTENAPAEISPEQRRLQGFVGIDRQLELPLPKVLLNQHPWYRNVKPQGARWRIFRESLGRLAAIGLPVYMVQPPISPAWRAYTADTFVDGAEREFSRMLAGAVSQFPNVRLLDFYASPDPRFRNEDFYDIQHFNQRGAAMFTRVLVDRIRDDLNVRGVGFGVPDGRRDRP